jgi:hypothetical protein
MAGEGIAKRVLINALHPVRETGRFISANPKRREACVSHNNLRSAFELLSDFKSGQLEPGAEISDEQVVLLDLLCKDLLPSEIFSLDHLESLIHKMACADSEWNRKCQITIEYFYSLSSVGKIAEADKIKNEFIGSCSSAWYRGIVDSL